MTHPTPSPSPAWLLCLASALTTIVACGDLPPAAEPQTERIAAALTDADLPLLPRTADDTSQDSQIGRLGGATIVGGRLAMLDLLPPHIKVFDTTGSHFAGFLTNGEGPGQMQMPVALATWDDSTIVVADVSGRLAMWTADGRLVREGQGVPGLAVMGMARCDNRLVVYGPSVDSVGTKVVWQWLRAVDADLVTVGNTGLQEGMEPGEIHGVGGKIYGFAVSGDSLLSVRHQFGPSPGVIQFACSDLKVGRRVFDLPASLKMPRPPSGGGPVAPPKSSGPRPAGMAVIGDELVLASLLVGTSSEDPDSTRYIVISGTIVDSIDVPGSHQLLGGTAELALVMEREPYQAVRVVPIQRP